MCIFTWHLYSILLHLAIMAANKDCNVLWEVDEKVDLYITGYHFV